MEREFGEISLEMESTGLSEAEEDRAIENPTITVKQQQKRSKASSAAQKQSQKGSIYVHQANTVWKAKGSTSKKKKEIFHS